jgi:hypothetical protein
MNWPSRRIDDPQGGQILCGVHLALAEILSRGTVLSEFEDVQPNQVESSVPEATVNHSSRPGMGR